MPTTLLSKVTRKFRDMVRYGLMDVLFPLTPALSRRERENSRRRFDLPEPPDQSTRSIRGPLSLRERVRVRGKGPSEHNHLRTFPGRSSGRIRILGCFVLLLMISASSQAQERGDPAQP